MTIRHLLPLGATLIVAGLAWLLFQSLTETTPATDHAPVAQRPETVAEQAKRAKGERRANSGDRRRPQAIRETSRNGTEDDPSDDGFDDGALADLGYSATEIRYMRELWQRFREDEAALAERIPKDGWLPEKARTASIREALRTDLGDEFYDAVLYATKQSNRARIGNVIATSLGAAAGLRIRDVIVSYNGERVFDPDDAKRLADASDPGKTVEIWIRRDGKDMQLFVDSGSLGVRYFPLRVAPSRAH